MRSTIYLLVCQRSVSRCTIGWSLRSGQAAYTAGPSRLAPWGTWTWCDVGSTCHLFHQLEGCVFDHPYILWSYESYWGMVFHNVWPEFWHSFTAFYHMTTMVATSCTGLRNGLSLCFSAFKCSFPQIDSQIMHFHQVFYSKPSSYWGAPSPQIRLRAGRPAAGRRVDVLRKSHAWHTYVLSEQICEWCQRNSIWVLFGVNVGITIWRLTTLTINGVVPRNHVLECTYSRETKEGRKKCLVFSMFLPFSM